MIKFSYFNFTDISFDDSWLIGIIKQMMVLPNRLQEYKEMFLKVIFRAHCR